MKIYEHPYLGQPVKKLVEVGFLAAVLSRLGFLLDYAGFTYRKDDANEHVADTVPPQIERQCKELHRTMLHGRNIALDTSVGTILYEFTMEAPNLQTSRNDKPPTATRKANRAVTPASVPSILHWPSGTLPSAR